MKKIIQGNLDELAPKHKGWFIGYFMEDESSLKTTDFEVKWAKLKAGDKKPKHRQNLRFFSFWKI
jgi:hypothetical protein